jgi:hypothetical protein
MAKAWSLAMTKDTVLERLGFAESRLEEFLALNGGDLAGASVSARQQLLQEFFFHLVGAIEMLAQLVNETRTLGIDPEDVSVLKVGQTLTSTDPVHAPLSALYTPTRGRALPTNPYDDYKREGWPEVVLTPRRNDKGRDIIASKPGFGSIRFIDQVKAYAPNHRVTADDVRALVGVLTLDQNVSKGIVTTTSQFAPGIEKDENIKRLLPYRLELKNGEQVRDWLLQLYKTNS